VGGYIYISTAVWRRKRAIIKLVWDLDCEYSPADNTLLARYAKFLTMLPGRRPATVNVLTRRNDDGPFCIFDLHYFQIRRIGDPGQDAMKCRTIIVLQHDLLDMPHFYIRPERGMDKLKNIFGGVTEAATQFKAGLNTLSGNRLSKIGIQVSDGPELGAWMNETEIKLPDQDDFNKAHWIQGPIEQALLPFLSKPITEFIKAEPGLVWEGSGDTFLLSGFSSAIEPAEYAYHLDLARNFIDLVLEQQASNSEA